MKRTLIVSNRAEADLIGIWLWRHEQFGEAQADRYLDELHAGLQACAAEPGAGKDRNAVRSGFWSKLVRKHVAFYTFTDAIVTVHRVLHSAMDPGRHV